MAFTTKIHACTGCSSLIVTDGYLRTTVILYESGLWELEAHASSYRMEEVCPWGEVLRKLQLPPFLMQHPRGTGVVGAHGDGRGSGRGNCDHKPEGGRITCNITDNYYNGSSYSFV